MSRFVGALSDLTVLPPDTPIPEPGVLPWEEDE